MSFWTIAVMSQDSLLLRQLLIDQIEDSILNSVISAGIQISEFSTRSGFEPGIEALVFVKGKTKSIELGVYFDNETKTLTGISFGHKYFILQNYFDKEGVIEPYIFYNFIYRVTTLKSLLTTNQYSILNSTLEPRYVSLEHYFGAGFEINFLNYFYINCNAGLGRFMGSIKNPELGESSDLYYGGNGWSGIYKFGIGVRIH